MIRHHLLKTFYVFLFLLIIKNAPGQVKESYPPLGKLVDAGGHLLHLNSTGTGGPVVILENGSGDFSFIWSLVQPEVAKFTQVVSYDRAGFAWSEPGPVPRSGQQIALELHTALQNAGIKGPYILVGQSFGGFLVRSFARYYPKEVTGMVLVEALHEDSRIIINNQPMRIREFASGRKLPAPQIGPYKNPGEKTGSIVIDTTIEPPLDRLPDSVQRLQMWAQSQPVYRMAADSEMTWSPEDVANMYIHKGEAEYMLGNIPLIVLTRGSGGYDGRVDSAALETERLKLQEDLAHLSGNHKHIIDKNSGHNIHLEDPQTVVMAIKEVWNAAKHHKKL
jgi:pimeloyl-ACP methyl ester carboxylesterase